MSTITSTASINRDSFQALKGQPIAQQLLLGMLQQKRIPNALLFHGIKGVGKRTAAKCLIAATCFPNRSVEMEQIQSIPHPDYLWVEPTCLINKELVNRSTLLSPQLGSNKFSIRIEQARQICQVLHPPVQSPKFWVIIEDADLLTLEAGNALLKLIEESPHTTFVLTTSNLNQVLPTILSRCFRIPFSPLYEEVIADILRLQDGIVLDPSVSQSSSGSVTTAYQLHCLFSEYPQYKELPQLSSIARILQFSSSLATLPSTSLLLLLQWWSSKATLPQLEQLERAIRQLKKGGNPQLVLDVCLMNL